MRIRHIYALLTIFLLTCHFQASGQLNMRIIAFRGPYWHLQLNREFKATDSIPMAADELAILTDGKLLYQLTGPGPKIQYMKVKNALPLKQASTSSGAFTLEQLKVGALPALASNRIALKYPISQYNTEEPSGFMLVINYPDAIRADAKEYKKRATLWADSLVLAEDQLKLPPRHPLGAVVKVVSYDHPTNMYNTLGQFTWYSADTLVLQVKLAMGLLKQYAPGVVKAGLERRLALSLCPGLHEQHLARVLNQRNVKVVQTKRNKK